LPPRVTAVVVSYNTREDLARCLDHLARQDEPVEIVVFDNASRDGSAEAARRPGVRLFASPVNQGYAAANNQAARKGKGRYVLFLNPDAFLPPDGARRLADALEGSPGLGGVAPQLVGSDGRAQRTCRRLPRMHDLVFELAGLSRLFPRSGFFNRWKMGPFDHVEPREVEQVYASCWLLRKADFLEFGGFDTRFPIFFNDVDLARRMVERGKYTLYYPEIRVIHRGGSSVKQLRSRSILQSHRSFFRYFAKYGSKGNPLLWLLGLLLAVAAPLRALLPEIA
jgi:N-acetylglucosaminyl-diphospho-decaprenol L-rhamnosyltransferase